MKMKRIYLIRHGKAEDGFNKPDFERELHPKGRKKTEKVARFLLDKNIQPQLIVASMAKRTMETAEVIRGILQLPKAIIQEEKNLYLASSNSILDTVYAMDDQINEVLLVGHNPGISSLSTYLSNQDIDWMTTSSLVAIEIRAKKWDEIDQAKRKMLFYVKPSDL
jgi:phosphohistidine phosphatase